MEVRMSEMTRVDIQKAVDRGFSTVIFAVGSNEQHGPCCGLESVVLPQAIKTQNQIAFY